MGSNKTIRDPMYGYIKIDYPFTVLIDTEEFQRLRYPTNWLSVAIS